MTRVVCAQVAPVLEDVQANRSLSVSAVESAVAAGADVVVLPELVTCGYCFETPAEVSAAAIDLDDGIFSDWTSAGGGALVVGGFAERAAAGRVYNSVAVVDGDGLRAVYRKVHLWDRERLFFTPGSQLPPVIDTAVGSLGVLVCYDLEFPEMTRSLALRGAELIAVPTNWPLVDRPPGERPPEVVIAMAAARVNRVHIACCDRTGSERGQEWTEGTAIVDVDGWVRTDPVQGPGFASADLDLALAREKDLSSRNHVFADRRLDVYGDGWPANAPSAG